MRKHVFHGRDRCRYSHNDNHGPLWLSVIHRTGRDAVMGYQCDNEDGMAAEFVMTMLDGGDTLALCGPCLKVWVGSSHAAMFAADVAAAAPAATDPVTGDETDEDEHADDAEPAAPVPNAEHKDGPAVAVKPARRRKPAAAL